MSLTHGQGYGTVQSPMPLREVRESGLRVPGGALVGIGQPEQSRGSAEMPLFTADVGGDLPRTGKTRSKSKGCLLGRLSSTRRKAPSPPRSNSSDKTHQSPRSSLASIHLLKIPKPPVLRFDSERSR